MNRARNVLEELPPLPLGTCCDHAVQTSFDAAIHVLHLPIGAWVHGVDQRMVYSMHTQVIRKLSLILSATVAAHTCRQTIATHNLLMKTPSSLRTHQLSQHANLNPLGEGIHHHHHITTTTRANRVETCHGVHAPQPKRHATLLRRVQVRWGAKARELLLPGERHIRNALAVVVHTIPIKATAQELM